MTGRFVDVKLTRKQTQALIHILEVWLDTYERPVTMSHEVIAVLAKLRAALDPNAAALEASRVFRESFVANFLEGAE
jgi:hypothetical protein